MKKIFSKILFPGLALKEYLTITTDKPLQEKAYLKNGDNFIDISKIHWLLCVEPVTFGVWLSKEDMQLFFERKQSTIYFTGSFCDDNNAAKKSLAILTVELNNKLEDENGTLLLFQVIYTKIKHLSRVKTFLIFSLFYKKPGISFQKFKTLVAAFSYPRKVCLISFQKDNYYNIFPMDLLGEIKNKQYVFGLRHSNSALEKIIETKKIVVADVSYKYKELTYQLGKHHSLNPPAINSLPFKIIHSASFRFPVPEFADNYKEIEILKSLNLGSQMLLWGKVINEVSLKRHESSLFHIHFLLYMHQQKKTMDADYKKV
ncbi:MAG: hypothetical protein JO072_08365 [Parafilimonas sp.]|nr:hypothetical protein [Parafilimonas sp.]